MSTSFRQTIYFFVLLCLANLIAAIFNHLNNYTGNLLDFFEVLPVFIATSFVFWAGCQWKPQTKFRYFFLPCLRILFWTSVVVIGILSDNRMGTEDSLYACNGLFFWWTWLRLTIPDLTFLNEFVELFLIDILFVAFGQFMLISLAIYLDRKTKNPKKKFD